MRRLFSGVLATLLLLSAALSSASAAQEATPAGGLADAGLPELAVTMTTTGYEGIPEQVDAGRYLVTLTIEEDAAEFGGGIAFAQPPEGMAADEFLTAFMSPPDESGVGEVASTPIAGSEATPTGGPPSFLFDATYAGGTHSFTGGVSQVVLDLTPGEWFAWADDPEAPQEPVRFEATGEMPDEPAEPEAAATITMSEYAIEVTDGELTAGPQTVRIDNVGAQPHFVGWFLGPDGMTEEQIATVLDEERQASASGTPPAWSGINQQEDLVPVAFTATQSTGTSIWITIDAPAGSHALLCFFPDISDGLEHAYHGMYTVVEIGG